ncbi:uncharacterized protein EI97DRAFT_435697 [Westerdykella ornata]|uniref:Initiator tRNA phosphoribosyl transferase n=1 Tax=Westerdykella ornata TaxID=318751 RepID=A0A6A6JDQ9_WESOR|nr:uncharacterized protein EI97DRAFT_435697 [Westerdykella ornata]KAF2273776.1 hypothetical protein EI97DRAFT_435697 [Westerdykella ornata]
MSRPLTQSDLIFPTNSLSLSSTLSSLKRSALSIPNRLASITSDSAFVISVSEAYGLPLVANERCGSWYIPPERKTGSCYFKSTDGHVSGWSFSLRRLNFQVLDVVGKHGGCVIVDSTRRGKSMPDALSKTIPIWTCVLNRALFPSPGPHHDLFTPPTAVSASEYAQIEKRIDAFVKSFLEICNPPIDHLRQLLSNKPLRPLWVAQSSPLPPVPPSFEDFHPIICCTASRRVHGAEASENGYIQGAADDHEAWARGLTPVVFWQNHDLLMTTNEEDLPSLIGELVAKERGPQAVPILIKPTSNLYVSASENLDLGPFDVIISCTPKPLTTRNREFVKSKKYLHLPLAAGKLGSRDLRVQLSRLQPFLENFSRERDKEGKEAPSILVCDPTGKDLAVGVALTILCLYADDGGNISLSSASTVDSAGLGKRKIDKTYIKQRLSWITTTSGALNPSRETLKAVNAFLMPDPGGKGKEVVVSKGEDVIEDHLVLVDELGNVIDLTDSERAEATTPEQKKGNDQEISLEKQDTPISTSHSKPESLDSEKPETLTPTHIPVTDIPYELLSKPSPPPSLQSPSTSSPTHAPTPPPLDSKPNSPPTPDPTTRSSNPPHHVPSSLPTQLFATLLSTPKYHFTRTLTSSLSTLPSGTATGLATFEPLSSSSSPSHRALLYIETADFVTENGVRLQATRRYVYRLETSRSTSTSSSPPPFSDTMHRDAGEVEGGEFIALYFPPDSPDAQAHTTSSLPDPDASNLFVEMGPISLSSPSSSSSPETTPVAQVYEAQHREKHLCGQDIYSAAWKFSGAMFDGGGAGARDQREGGNGKESGRDDEDDDNGGGKWWEVRYDVVGPRKRYVSVTRYTAVL